jgi:hypothetical protein
VGANKAKVASSNLASGSAQIVKGRKNTTMKFREKMEKFEKKEEVTFSNEYERQHLIELGVQLAQTDQKVADGIFKKAHASNQEIQAQFAVQELKQIEKEQRSQAATKKMREDVETMYKRIIEEAKRKGDQDKIRVYEAALKVLKKEQEK